MATLHDMAVNMPLTYITATFDTVTTPDSLVHLFDEYFQYFTHKGHPEPQDAEQVRPILDLINTTALPSASTGDILQGGSESAQYVNVEGDTITIDVSLTVPKA